MNYKIVHLCLRVMDLEKSVDFYKKALGFRELRRKDYPEDEFTLVFMTDEEGLFDIELTYNYHPEKPYEIGNGFSHFAVTVEDLEKSRENHLALGYKCTDLYGLRAEAPRFYFLTDPDGYDIEIIRESSEEKK